MTDPTPARVRLQCICGQGFEHTCVVSWERPNGEYLLVPAPAERAIENGQRAEQAEAEAQQWREATGKAIGQLRQAEAALAAFKDQVQAIADEARGSIRQQLGYALAALDEHQEPCPYTHAHTRHWCGYEQCRDS